MSGMDNYDGEDLAGKAGCFTVVLLIVGGLISFLADFWYIFLGILLLIIFLYVRKR